MKGIWGFIGIAAVIYIFWVTLEYFNLKRKNNNNDKKQKNEKSS